MTEENSFILESIFATPVIIAQVADLSDINVALEKAILARRKSDPGIVRTNVGGWHSRVDFFSWAGEAGNVIARHVIELADLHTHDTAPPANGRRGWRLHAWANVIDREGGHDPHIHPGAYWSAVYYVRVDPGSGGKLMLDDPRGPMSQMHAPDLRLRGVGPERRVETIPEPGKLIIFPSWLMHSVEPYRGEGRRISVAINLLAGS